MVRRWFRVACFSYDPDYVTYLGKLGRDQPHPIFKSRKNAITLARREINAIQRMGVEAKIWRPLPIHQDSGHIHIVALIEPKQLRHLFPTEYEGLDA